MRDVPAVMHTMTEPCFISFQSRYNIMVTMPVRTMYTCQRPSIEKSQECCWSKRLAGPATQLGVAVTTFPVAVCHDTA